MAIVDDDLDELPPPPPAPVKVDEGYRGIAVDTRRHPVQSLLIHIEGSPWTVRYFSQILGSDSQVNVQQLNLSPVYQQYTCIENLELKVTSPLSQSMETPSNSMTVTGTASVYPFLIPNQGDMFVADIGDGKLGVFTVTSVERKTILRETCYEINYELVSYYNDEYRQDLEAKTVKRVFFHKDFLARGQNPMLIEEEARQVLDLGQMRRTLLAHYVPKFFNREYRTLTVRWGEKVVYDHFLTRHLLRVIEVGEHPLLREVNVLNCDGIALMDAYTLWDVLEQLDPLLLPMAVRKIQVDNVSRHRVHPAMRGIAHSGVKYFIYPAPSLQDQDAPEPPQGDEPVLIHPTPQDHYYVLSRAFYDDLDGKSQLELEVLKCLKDEAMDHGRLLALAEASLTWEDREQFYYIPIILLLMKVALRRL